MFLPIMQFQASTGYALTEWDPDDWFNADGDPWSLSTEEEENVLTSPNYAFWHHLSYDKTISDYNTFEGDIRNNANGWTGVNIGDYCVMVNTDTQQWGISIVNGAVITENRALPMAIASDEWYHLKIVWNDTAIYAYINGQGFMLGNYRSQGGDLGTSPDVYFNSWGCSPSVKSLQLSTTGISYLSDWTASPGWGGIAEGDEMAYTAPAHQTPLSYVGELQEYNTVDVDMRYNNFYQNDQSSGFSVGGYYIYLRSGAWTGDSGQGFYIEPAGGSVGYELPAGAIAADEWYHMKAFWDDTKISVFLNGDLIMEASTESPLGETPAIVFNSWAVTPSVKNLALSVSGPPQDTWNTADWSATVAPWAKSTQEGETLLTAPGNSFSFPLRYTGHADS
jgi:hypothetical protein